MSALYSSTNRSKAFRDDILYLIRSEIIRLAFYQNDQEVRLHFIKMNMHRRHQIQMLNQQNKLASELKKFIQTIRIPQTNNPLCSNLRQTFQVHAQDPKQLTQQFTHILKLFNHSTEVQHTKTQLCGQLLKRGDKAYKCHNCIYEDNSILCGKCFDLQKHKDHQFQRIDVFGGCCDCGDIQKWAKEGFCSAHCDQIDVEIKLDQKLTALFLQQQHFLLTIFLQMYSQFVDYLQKTLQFNQELQKTTLMDIQKQASKKTNLDLLDYIRKFVDLYGVAVVSQLIEFNKVGKYANAMTAKLLDSTLQLDENARRNIRGNNVLQQMFQLIELQDYPEKVCDLCITLFSVKNFREYITEFYIQRYNEDSMFATSSYSHLSSQLFTSHLVILKLVNERKVRPIQYIPKVGERRSIKEVAQGFIRYFYDIIYLSKLQGNSSVEYFKYHAGEKMMRNLGYYRIAFNQCQDSSTYYGLEDLYLNRMLYVVGVMHKDTTREIYRLAMRDLYEFITTTQTNSANLYRSQQRLFALIVFSYLQGDINTLDNPQKMEQFLSLLGVGKLRLQLTRVLKNMSYFFYDLARVYSSPKLINQNITLFSFYFKRSSLIFNLDSILMKILIKMCDYYNQNTHNEIQTIKYELILLECGDKATSVFNKLNYLQPNRMNNQQTTINIYTLTVPQIKQFIKYLGLITEALYSDLPELSLMCQLQSYDDKKSRTSIFKLPLEELAFHYYGNILKSCENTRISIKDFKLICQPFFKQQLVFKQFVNANMDRSDNRRLDASTCKANKFSLLYYQSIAIQAKGISPQATMTKVPYKKQYTTARFCRIDLPFYAKKAKLAIDCLQYQHLHQAKITKQALVIQVFSELWKIVFQAGHSHLYEFICDLVSYQPFFNAISQLGEQISAYVHEKQTETISPNKYEPIVDESKTANNSLRREKRESKKSKLLQKMSKGAQQFLDKQTIVNNQRCCVICRDDKGLNPLCLSGFMSFSNYHGWFKLSVDFCVPIFNSCGHLVHRHCYKKTLTANRIYNWCSLCKSPVNILIPTELNHEDELLSFEHDYCEVVNCIFQNPTDFTLSQQLLRSIVMSLICKGLVSPLHLNKDLPLLRYIVVGFARLLKQQKRCSSILSCSKLNYQIPTDIFPIFVYAQSSLYSKLVKSNQTQIENKIILSKAFMNSIDQVVALLTDPQLTPTTQTNSLMQCEQINILRATIKYLPIDQQLADLSNRYMGKCLNCGLVTNQQAICLICPNFATCINCDNIDLLKHTRDMHMQCGCFIKSFTGEIIYLYKSRHWKFQSVYEDYIGRPYDPRNSTSNRRQFKLIDKKLQTVREDILNNTIQLKIRYKQKSQNKVNYDLPL